MGCCNGTKTVEKEEKKKERKVENKKNERKKENLETEKNEIKEENLETEKNEIKEENLEKEKNERKEENKEKEEMKKKEIIENNVKKPEKEEIFEEGKIIKQCINGDPSFVPDELIDILRESVVRIEVKNPQKFSSGFFIKISLKMKEYKFLLTCFHSISQNLIDSKIKISIYYGKKNEEIKKKIILDTNERFIKAYENFDVTVIEIKDEDGVSENRFLYPDLNYKMGLNHYLNAQVYTAGYPNVKIHKGDKHYSAGFIKNVHPNGCFFGHNCDTIEGSSGGPIINYDKLVIGIHFGSYEKGNINLGTFIGIIINELFLEEKKINPMMKDDDIEDDHVNPLKIGFDMLGKMFENQDFINMTNEIAKNIDINQMMSNLVSPEFEKFKPTDEEIEKFKDKDENIDIEGLCKYNLGKVGYSKNDQDIVMDFLNKIGKDMKIGDNQNES